MEKRTDDLAYRRINRLTAIQLATTSMVILVVAIVAILQNGQMKQLVRRIETLEGRIAQLESDTRPRLDPADVAPPRPAVDRENAKPDPSTEPPAALTEPSPIEREVTAMAARLGDERARLSHADVEAALQRLDSADPSTISPGACLAAAELALAIDDSEGAVEWADRARSRGAESHRVATLLAYAHARTGDIDAAIEQARIAAAARDPDPHVRLLLGRLESENGEFDKAKATLAGIIEDPAVRTEAVDLLAQIHLVRDEPLDAVALLEEALAESPAEPILLRRLAMARRDAGLFDDCASAARAAIGAGADDPAIGVVLGECLMQSGDVDTAARTADALTTRYPDRYDVWMLTGAVRLARLEPAAADAYEQAVRIAPASAEARYRLGVARANADECEQAIEAFKASVAIDDTFAHAHFARAICLARLGRTDEAEASLVRALSLDESLMQTAEQVPALAKLIAPPAGASGIPARGGSP